MTDDPTATIPNGPNRTRTTRSGGLPSRRDVLKAVGAGGVAVGVGLGATGSVSASGHRGIDTPWLHVEGNRVLDPLGNEVILRGVNIPDPKRLDYTVKARGKNAAQLIDLATDPDRGWYSRVIRLPVHPGDIAGLPPVPEADVDVHWPPTFTREQLLAYLEEHLDPAVELCKEYGVYCIVDYHRHWGDGALEWIDEDLAEEVTMFWDTVAPRYADQSHVIYELYNEPTLPGMYVDEWYNAKYAGIWRMWKQTAQPWLDTIREHAPRNLVIVGSPGWSAMPEGAQIEEFDGENLMYAYHIYGGHGLENDADFDGRASEEGTNGVWQDVPLFMTEFGWEPNVGQWISGTTDGFGRAVAEWADERPIHWTAWCFDVTWLPRMWSRAFVDEQDADSVGDPYSGDIPELCPDPPCEWNLLGRDEGDFEQYSGEYIRQWLEDRADDDVPQVPADDQPPAAPSGVAASLAGDSSAQVSWNPVTDTGPSDLAHYTVWVDGDARVETTDTSAVVDRLYAGTTHEIAVTATDLNGNVSEPGTTTVTPEPIADDEPPSAPGAITLTDRTYTSVTLSWGASTASGPAAVLEYVVSLEGGEFDRVPADQTTCPIEGLEPGEQYSVAVVAVDQTGNESEPSSAVVEPRPPRATESDVLINDFEGAEPLSENSLGGWTGGALASTVEDGVAIFEWDNITYHGTAIDMDISDRPVLTFYARGERGFELSTLALQVGGVEDVPVGDATDDRIGTDWSVVSIDLEALGADLTDPGQLQLDSVWGTRGRFEVDSMWLAGEDDPADGVVERDVEPEPGIDVGDYTARDPNGDGLYTDVNGNGGNDFDDVVTFFAEMNSEGVQNNVDAFDFNGNGQIDFDDVVALFEQI